jgi:hypothetical protein
MAAPDHSSGVTRPPTRFGTENDRKGTARSKSVVSEALATVRAGPRL